MRRLYRNTLLFSSVGIGSVITLYLRNKSLNGISNDQEALRRPGSAIIIGGGIIGISSALQLAKRGVNVTVLEEQPGNAFEDSTVVGRMPEQIRNIVKTNSTLIILE